ncbi:hypothetical protein CYANOKiyG1_30410 [Okeania sp. KiyG1]|nr:hypothetical protein CYANOKiyG1_30410 [Okeania sp. KiyG1]
MTGLGSIFLGWGHSLNTTQSAIFSKRYPPNISYKEDVEPKIQILNNRVILEVFFIWIKIVVMSTLFTYNYNLTRVYLIFININLIAYFILKYLTKMLQYSQYVFFAYSEQK